MDWLSTTTPNYYVIAKSLPDVDIDTLKRFVIWKHKTIFLNHNYGFDMGKVCNFAKKNNLIIYKENDILIIKKPLL